MRGLVKVFANYQRSPLFWLIAGLIVISISGIALLGLVVGQVEHRQTVAHGTHAKGTVVATDLHNRFPTVTVKLSDGRTTQLFDYPGEPKVGDELKIAYPPGHLEDAVSVDSKGDPLWVVAAEIALAVLGILLGMLFLITSAFLLRRPTT